MTTCTCLAPILLAVLPAAIAPAGPAEDQARQILDATGIRGGLIVHLGCGDGRLTAALHAGDAYLVHGLDTDAANVAKARETIHSQGRYGKVSAGRFDAAHLPYAENIVNLLVAEDLGDVAMNEVLRVLAPGGVAYVQTGGGWAKTIKPWPAEMDEWTHFLHDASNNAVADDTQVGPPRRLRWACGPLWTRSHEFNSSLVAMVSGGGRLFYVFDEGLTGVTAASIPQRWTLIARDAFNGLLLWKRPLIHWGTRAWRSRALRNVPATVARRVVAEGDRLFVTLGYDVPVSILDAATGEVLATCEGTAAAEELRCLDGVLLVRRGRDLLMGIDTKTGKKLWEAAGKIQPLSLAAHDGNVFYQDGPSLMCLQLSDGKRRWRAPVKSPAALLVVHDDCVVLSSKSGLQAVSIDTGKPLWTSAERPARNELFVAQQQLWYWEGHGIVGRDLATGKVTTHLNTDDVFTPGHHLRCYQGKATEQFLITPNRGVEFVSLTGAANTQNDWVRGSCRYGIMPCNGLLYVPPNPCFCYPGVKLTGFNALAANKKERGEKREERGANGPTPRLERGPAYVPAVHPSSFILHPSRDWPTYRHDARRSGATACGVAARVSPQWQVQLPGKLTPPVVAGDRLYVAVKGEHTLYALDAGDGRKLWRFTAGGPIDSPPTVFGPLVLFGGADGCVYCLRAADGELVWRFTAAPAEELIIALGRLESPWRVHGSVLVKDGLVYCTAGRSSYLDGGIRLFALDPATGKVVHQAQLDTWARTREDAENKPFVPAYHIEGALSDILVSQDDAIYLGQYKFDPELNGQDVPYVMPELSEKTVTMELSKEPYTAEDENPKADYEKHQRDWIERTQKDLVARLRETHGQYGFGQRRTGLHVLATGGFLDDSWFNRTYWTYSTTWPGFYLGHRGAKTGHLLVVGPEKTYAVTAYPSRNLQSPLFTPAGRGYLLLADDNDNEPVLDTRTRETTKGRGYGRAKPPVWHRWLPVRIRGMVLAGKTLFAAGPPDVVDADDPMAAFEGRKGGVLLAVSPTDGQTLAEYKLDSPPEFDGMIAAAGRLYISLTSGEVLCLGENPNDDR